MPRVLVLDNYDSFTYNLVQYLAMLGASCEVVLSDRITVGEIHARAPDGVLISPGPGTPDDAGVSLALLRDPRPLPILGVCLGHQAIGQAFGARVVRAGRIMHGKTSPIFHDGRSIFATLDDPFEATRYHSLIVDRASVPSALTVSAWTTEGEIMGLRHGELPIEGVQFHPESILTGAGMKLLGNWLASLSTLSPRAETS